MADWQPELYARYGDERLQPVLDLLARVPLDRPARIVDLGCGAAASTEPLVRRWPEAEVVGLDTSPAMLATARRKLPGVAFVEADLVTWQPDAPVDLIFANAVLQWVPDLERVLPRLMGFLAPGGVLAVQMPRNLDEPSHALMCKIAALPAFADRLSEAVASRPGLPPADTFYDWLSAEAADVQVWLTTYHHPLADAAAIVEMVSSTGLKPYLDALPPPLAAEFRALYTAAVAEAYPPRADGRVLFRFPRLFLVARR